MNGNTAVSAELGLRLIAAEQTIVPLVASLYYTDNDPYAVRVAFHIGTDEPVEWIFARDLLAAGIVSPEGIGDVRIWPSVEARRTGTDAPPAIGSGTDALPAPWTATEGMRRRGTDADGLSAADNATEPRCDDGESAHTADIHGSDVDGVVNIELSSPFGQAHFEAPAAALADFLQRTYSVVPRGRENNFVDIDAELAALFAQS